MDDSSLDEGPSVDFGRATLQIAKENEAAQENRAQSLSTALDNENSVINNATGTTPITNNLPSIPYKRVDAHTYFSDRNDVVERAIKDCTHTLIKDADGEVIGCWLLTQISLWDTEKERLILLTRNALYTIKYDFISLKTLEYGRVPLPEIDTVVNGELVYPPTSLVPRLNGLAEGVSSVFHNAVRQQWSSFTARSSIAEFESRSRNMVGLQLMWNKGKPLPLEKKWNPFARNIPWMTFASHPLFWHKGTESEKMKFDVEGLHAALLSLIAENCHVVSNSIVLENYLGLGALLHNRNALGFFKIRGKVSF
ncbi:tumor protein p63-regulated gene 1-like protein isoform X1 [Athalia rosae]|uniref:tumor protein p63-regulated gene 1-like protein isoform X1 n=1 Tax=Athalia rosae TaxID=37344 RepID=UPI0020345A9D|nr:tumor protein p63-regulated gene 1-like protein isoform X1 [Athalia rosae]XP_020712503.2 tumor protein p63-regulated gene 1-like protein isoform X1 [Athalia rosae]